VKDADYGMAKILTEGFPAEARALWDKLTPAYVSSSKLNLQLISANWPITETEYVLIRIGGVILAFGLGWLVSQMLVSGVGLAAIAFFIPDLVLKRAISKRRMNFGSQLVDVLILMTGAVRAGYSLPQAIEVVSKEMRAPASEEFRRVRHEIGLGLSLTQALNNLVARMENDDLYLVVTAININQQVGGNLVTMLDAVTGTIRERIRLFAEVRVLTSQQRFSAYILTLIPLGVGAMMFALNPNYMSGLFTPGVWLCIPAGALMGMVLGNIWIRKLAKIEV